MKKNHANFKIGNITQKPNFFSSGSTSPRGQIVVSASQQNTAANSTTNRGQSSQYQKSPNHNQTQIRQQHSKKSSVIFKRDEVNMFINQNYQKHQQQNIINQQSNQLQELSSNPPSSYQKYNQGFKISQSPTNYPMLKNKGISRKQQIQLSSNLKARSQILDFLSKQDQQDANFKSRKFMQNQFMSPQNQKYNNKDQTLIHDLISHPFNATMTFANNSNNNFPKFISNPNSTSGPINNLIASKYLQSSFRNTPQSMQGYLNNKENLKNKVNFGSNNICDSGQQPQQFGLSSLMNQSIYVLSNYSNDLSDSGKAKRAIPIFSKYKQDRNYVLQMSSSNQSPMDDISGGGDVSEDFTSRQYSHVLSAGNTQNQKNGMPIRFNLTQNNQVQQEKYQSTRNHRTQQFQQNRQQQQIAGSLGPSAQKMRSRLAQNQVLYSDQISKSRTRDQGTQMLIDRERTNDFDVNHIKEIKLPLGQILNSEQEAHFNQTPINTLKHITEVGGVNIQVSKKQLNMDLRNKKYQDSLTLSPWLKSPKNYPNSPILYNMGQESMKNQQIESNEDRGHIKQEGFSQKIEDWSNKSDNKLNSEPLETASNY
eukprot:403333436